MMFYMQNTTPPKSTTILEWFQTSCRRLKVNPTLAFKILYAWLTMMNITSDYIDGISLRAKWPPSNNIISTISIAHESIPNKSKSFIINGKIEKGILSITNLKPCTTNHPQTAKTIPLPLIYQSVTSSWISPSTTPFPKNIT